MKYIYLDFHWFSAIIFTRRPALLEVSYDYDTKNDFLRSNNDPSPKNKFSWIADKSRPRVYDQLGRAIFKVFEKYTVLHRNRKYKTHSFEIFHRKCRKLKSNSVENSLGVFEY